MVIYWNFGNKNGDLMGFGQPKHGLWTKKSTVSWVGIDSFD
jgi:hypothetical protein